VGKKVDRKARKDRERHVVLVFKEERVEEAHTSHEKNGYRRNRLSGQKVFNLAIGENTPSRLLPMGWAGGLIKQKKREKNNGGGEREKW